MDLSAMLLPGAQKVATAMLGDAWTATRDAIARRWGKGDKKAVDKVTSDLEVSRTQALSLIDGGSSDERLLTVFWMGYLAGIASEHPDWLAELVEPVPVSTASETVGIANYGKIGNLVKVDGDIHGGFRM
jgi:hypothetical protein